MPNKFDITQSTPEDIVAFTAERTEEVPHSCYDKPLVSICCLTYNHEAFIAQAIDSFLMQETDFSVEVIIGEDCSTDRTRDIVLEYQKNHADQIRVILSTENLGKHTGNGRLNFLRNLKACRGKYIALCEGDDYWTNPLKLQKQVDFLEANPGYVVTYHNADIVDENGALVEASKLPDIYQKDFTASELRRAPWILTLTMCFRNVITGFPLECLHVHNGDSCLISLLSEHGKGKYLGEEISPAKYRTHAGGVWSEKKKLFRKKQSQLTYIKLGDYHVRRGNKEASEYFRDLSIGIYRDILIESRRAEHYYLPCAVMNYLLHYKHASIPQRILDIARILVRP